MKWIKFSNKIPPHKTNILYYDSNNETVNELYSIDGYKIQSLGYYCNVDGCDWTFDDCGCNIVTNPNDYWMLMPQKPNESNTDEEMRTVVKKSMTEKEADEMDKN